MSFEAALGELGFTFVQERRNGDRQYAKRSNPYLSWWLMTHSDGTVELSWEFELGEYMRAKGFHVSVQDELSLLIFPSGESRGPADHSWLRSEIDRAERLLASVDFLTGV